MIPQVSRSEALLVWVRVGLLSFGGPAAQISVMHRLLVEEKGWVSESQFLHALNYCMLLPGPEAQQLAVYIGWLLHGTSGGLVAGLLFILPGFLSILALSVAYVLFQQTLLINALLLGLKSATLAIVLQAVVRLAGRSLTGRNLQLLAALAFLAIFFGRIPFPAIILIAGLLGLTTADVASATPRAGGQLPKRGRTARVLLIGLTTWFAPLALLAAWLGPNHSILVQALFFSKVSLVTFGGAYSVLAYVAQQAVEVHHWLQPAEMLDGLGMAETTPGPLIQVVQFVAFLGAFRQPGPLSPMAAALLASLVTAWVTFVPCFLWIFLGAPYVEHLRNHPRLSAALSAITAAVVGVILNLALWFALHVLFGRVDEFYWHGLRLLSPQLSTLQPTALLIALASALGLFHLRWGLFATLLGACLASVLSGLAFP